MKTMTVAFATVTVILLSMSITPLLVVPARAATYGDDWHLKVFAPTPYQVVTGPYLAIHAQSINYQLNSRYAGTPNLPTIGHYHEILDGKLIDMSPTTDSTQTILSCPFRHGAGQSAFPLLSQ